MSPESGPQISPVSEPSWDQYDLTLKHQVCGCGCGFAADSVALALGRRLELQLMGFDIILVSASINRFRFAKLTSSR